MVIFHEIQCDGADRRKRAHIEERVQHPWCGIRHGAVRFNLYYVRWRRMAKALWAVMWGNIGSRYFHWWSINQNDTRPHSNTDVTIESATFFDLCVFIFSVWNNVRLLFSNVRHAAHTEHRKGFIVFYSTNIMCNVFQTLWQMRLWSYRFGLSLVLFKEQ